MRLLVIEGNMISVYEGRRRLAVFEGALQICKDSAEQLRLASTASIAATPIEKKPHDAA